jgi:dienelactone hydrolase
MTRRLLALGLLACVALTGCARMPMKTAAYTGPAPLPEWAAAYYDYPKTERANTIELLEERARFRRWMVRFPLSPPEGLEPTEPTVEFEWLESRQPGRRPAVLLSPILGGDYPLERGIARFFAEHGLHVALVHRKTLKVAPEKDAAHLELLLRQAVIRNRQVVDWMETNERVDPDRMGSYGISMGGIANVITGAIEPRLRCHVIVLAGGSLADILRDSKDSLLTKPRARYLAHHHITVEQMHQLLTEHLRTDPLAFAPHLDARRTLWFVALADRTIGRKNALQLWRAAGRPEVIMLPTGHYTSYLYLPVLKRQSLRFLRKHLTAL